MQPYYFGRDNVCMLLMLVMENLLLNDIEAVHGTPSRD